MHNPEFNHAPLYNQKGMKNSILYSLFDTAVVIKGCLRVITVLGVGDIYIMVIGSELVIHLFINHADNVVMKHVGQCRASSLNQAQTAVYFLEIRFLHACRDMFRSCTSLPLAIFLLPGADARRRKNP